MASPQPAESLRILCLDGGGIKGYTSLLILKRIFRTMVAEGQLSDTPRPCNVFDLIVGTSTGGLIAVMLGRLHMTIDECIAQYEQVGKEVFGKKPHGGKLGKILKGLRSSPLYDIKVLQEEVKRVLDSKEVPHNQEFLEQDIPLCKVMLCVTRTEISKPDVLRNYLSLHPTAENYQCRIWEAAGATAAAPMYFQGVQINGTGEKWCDGGLRRNNPINEALSEISRERDWENKKIGCVLSLGTGIAQISAISSNLAGFLKGTVAIMTDSDDTAKVFAISELGISLFRTSRYFRFSVPQGMQDLQIDEWEETEKMKALTTHYLGDVGSGDQVKLCARSLLYPDENLQLGIKPKRSIMPHQPCVHFIERRLYSDTLLNFFRVKTESAQIFVLWGLGGIVKTQIALKFAQSMKQRLSIFWIRGDQFTNFAADYAQILNELGPNNEYGAGSSLDLPTMLGNIRSKLEEISHEWLLILDNADDLDSFFGKDSDRNDINELAIGRFIPHRGRILITTRDRRFQGAVAAANNGLRVESMSEAEAMDLLMKSVPSYLIRNQTETLQQGKHLLDELGHLPLAIAQAAANIVEQQLTLEEYVSFYKEKKHRMGLMQAPAHDFQSTDPRNCSQSVNITWQVSFDILAEKFPSSAVFLSYIGCFHWRNVPRILLQKLPEFHAMELPAFIQLTKKPLNLSLVEEEESEPGFVEYHVHPLVHENILHRLSSSDIARYAEPVIQVLSEIFPYVDITKGADWDLAAYLAPHALRQLELAKEAGLPSEKLPLLLHHVSRFFGFSKMFEAAADLAKRVLQMGLQVWGANTLGTYIVATNAIQRYIEASRYSEAEQETRRTLLMLDSGDLRADLGQIRIEEEKIKLMTNLSACLHGLDQHQEREAIHRKQLESGLVNLKTEQGVTIKHNLAHALLYQGKFGEAKAINNELLEWCETEDGKRLISPRLYTTMLNLKASLLRQYKSSDFTGKGMLLSHENSVETKAERLRIHQLVYDVSVQKLGFEDIDTWKAINNLTGCLMECFRYEEMGSVLRKVLSAGISVKLRAEGMYNVPLRQITGRAAMYLETIQLSKVSDDNERRELEALLGAWVSSSGCSTMGILHEQLNFRGVQLQTRGKYQEAETLHRRALDLSLEDRLEIGMTVYFYNIMLAIARQGRVEEATAFRAEHQEPIERCEMQFGKLEDRLEGDRKDEEIYQQARAMHDSGRLFMEDEWWTENREGLERAQLRFGALGGQASVQVVEKDHTDLKKKKKNESHSLGLKFPIRLRKKPQQVE